MLDFFTLRRFCGAMIMVALLGKNIAMIMVALLGKNIAIIMVALLGKNC